MKIFKVKQELNTQSINALRELIGKKVDYIRSPAINVESSGIIEAFSFSISYINDKSGVFYINISNHWLESPNDTTYHQLTVEKNEYPKGIKYIWDNRMKRKIVHHPVSSISLNHNSILKKIEIYSVNEEWYREESILYDYGLIFHYDNGFKFSINVYEASIADELQLIKDEGIIKEQYSACESILRLSIS